MLEFICIDGFRFIVGSSGDEAAQCFIRRVKYPFDSKLATTLDGTCNPCLVAYVNTTDTSLIADSL